MSTSESDNRLAGEAGINEQSESSDFSAPLGMLKSGHLIFASTVQGLELAANPSISDLYQARFRRHIPRLRHQQGIVTVEYPRSSFLDRIDDSNGPLAEFLLNGSIPWEIEFHDGVSDLKASLGELQLISLDILGGASNIMLLLPMPARTTFIYISGGIRHSAIRVPSTAEIRVLISGGSTDLVYEDQRLGAMGGETVLESPGFESQTARYDICISGGASNFTIDRKG